MFLGIDTSNYTTSVALCDTNKMSVAHFKQPLTVKEGELGLRQADALFNHVVNLPNLIEQAMADMPQIEAVGVSVRPRDIEGSYMPCFLAGKSVAQSISASLNVPLYSFSHQAGHIAAALYSSNMLDLIGSKFIAFHFSGGTSEAVLCSPDEDMIFKTELISSSLDLKAGQAIDRVGNMLGLSFPAGKELDMLACESDKIFKVKPYFKDGCPSISGLENKCRTMLESGEKPCDIARFTVDYICAVVENMTEFCLDNYGDLPLVYSGGVMSNSIISRIVGEKFGGHFAKPEYSCDNASGLAVLSAYRSGRLD